MSWDSTKNPGDTVLSSDWNNMVSDQKSHHTEHSSGGRDEIRLDLLAAPTDITTLNVSIAAHGLCPKLPNDILKFLAGDGSWQTGATVSSVVAGNGMTFSTITTTGSVTMGTPGSVTSTSTNAVASGTHTHAADSTIVTLTASQVLTQKTLTSPTIGDFTNMGHTHTTAGAGGQLTDAALSAAVSIAKGGTGQTTNTLGFDALAPTTSIEQGDILYYDGSHWVLLHHGNAGEVLATGGHAANPAWSSSSGISASDAIGYSIIFGG